MMMTKLMKLLKMIIKNKTNAFLIMRQDIRNLKGF